VERSIRFTAVVVAGLLWHSVTLSAQLKLGETSSRANGSISSGYSATYGNSIQSSHGWSVGGAGTLSGSYHSPNFLSYNFSPYLNQSRSNSNFQSISNASGVNLSTNIFGGSKFPGSISYSKAYNSDGNYGIPGLANYVTHGSNHMFGINWSELLEGKPTFSAGYQTGGSRYSVYGSQDSGVNSFRSVNLHSNYRWEGFGLGAFYVYGNNHAMVPQLGTGEMLQTHTNTTVYGLTASHQIPLKGSASGSINRSNWKSEFLDYNSSGTIDTVNSSAGIHPFQKLTVTGTVNYSDNLSGQLVQSVISAGGVASGINTDQSSHSLDLMAVATYAASASLQTSGSVEHRTQSFMGQNYGVTSYGGEAVFTHGLLNGTFNSALSIIANQSMPAGSDTLGMTASESYSSIVMGWHVAESFSYAQDAQTLLVTYTNSFYNFSGNVRRNWGQFNVSAGAGGSRTALTAQPDTANSSESYTASMGYGRFLAATASYSKADGQALATGSGLVGSPIPTPVLPSDLVSLFGGRSYSASLSSTPVKHFIMSASYARSINNTVSSGVFSANSNAQFNTLLQYQVRKMSFISGYSRLQQGFSAARSQPEILSSYYMGLSRWFNFF